MVGKTIAAVEDRGYEGATLRFTDGTSVDIIGGGYEDSAVTLEELSVGQTLAADAARERERLADLREEEKRRQARELREERCATAKALLTPEAYQEWLQENYGLSAWQRVLREVYDASAIDAAREANRQCFGQTITIPVKRAAWDPHDQFPAVRKGDA